MSSAVTFRPEALPPPPPPPPEGFAVRVAPTTVVCVVAGPRPAGGVMVKVTRL
jgi:hypothetical protein